MGPENVCKYRDSGNKWGSARVSYHPHHALLECNKRGFHAMIQVATIEVPPYEKQFSHKTWRPCHLLFSAFNVNRRLHRNFPTTGYTSATRPVRSATCSLVYDRQSGANSAPLSPTIARMPRPVHEFENRRSLGLNLRDPIGGQWSPAVESEFPGSVAAAEAYCACISQCSAYARAKIEFSRYKVAAVRFLILGNTLASVLEFRRWNRPAGGHLVNDSSGIQYRDAAWQKSTRSNLEIALAKNH